MTQEPTMKAEQRHREAAADLGFRIGHFSAAAFHNCKAGFMDHDPLVQDFVKFDAERTARIEELERELAAEREKFTMHTAEVGAWLSLLAGRFGLGDGDVKTTCSQVYDRAGEALASEQKLAEAVEMLGRSLAYLQSTLGVTQNIRTFIASLKGSRMDEIERREKRLRHTNECVNRMGRLAGQCSCKPTVADIIFEHMVVKRGNYREKAQRAEDAIIAALTPAPAVWRQPNNEVADMVFSCIAHGDEAHRAWLQDTLRRVFSGELVKACVPPQPEPRS